MNCKIARFGLMLLAVGCQSSDREHQESAEVTLPKDPTRITIVQRRTARVPGTVPSMVIHIGDITNGEVLTRLSTTQDPELVANRAMRVGDAADFTVNGHEQTLGLARLVNYLIGDDYAEFLVGSPSVVCNGQIDGYLERIESSDKTFTRNGRKLPGPAMAKHLRQRRTQAGAKIRTAKDFLNQVAARSNPSAKPYTVQVMDQEIPLRVWLGARSSRD